jgi:hypothetical protein
MTEFEIRRKKRMLELGDTIFCYYKVREFFKYLLLSYRQRGILENICSTDVTPRGGGVDILYILYANGEAEKGANLQEKGRKKRDKGKMDGKKIKYLQIRGGDEAKSGARGQNIDVLREVICKGHFWRREARYGFWTSTHMDSCIQV